MIVEEPVTNTNVDQSKSQETAIVPKNNQNQNQNQNQGFDCESIKKNTYKHQLFCWIQEEKTAKVIEFYENYPGFIDKFTTFNNWSPAMCAVRYGNFQLLDYFVKKNHMLDAKNIYKNTVIHAACYANNPNMLIYLLKKLERSPNPVNSDPSPLKFSIKTNNPKLLEILACYGAYYIFDEIFNNVRKQIHPQKDQPVYYSLITKKQILSAMIVKDVQLKQFPIKQSLRWVRAHNFMIVKKGVENNPRTTVLNKIFQNPEYMENILKYCVGSGRHLFANQSDANSQQGH